MRIALALIAGAAFLAVPAAAQDTNTENAVVPPPAVATADNNAQAVEQQAVPISAPEPEERPVTAPRPARDRGFPWGVIGLIGLVGLQGRRRS